MQELTLIKAELGLGKLALRQHPTSLGRKECHEVGRELFGELRETARIKEPAQFGRLYDK
jgi:hypothetical protein